MSLSGVDINYMDFITQLGYRAYQNYFILDLNFGYRMVNFAIDGSEVTEKGPIDITKSYDVDFTLEGPFIGLTFTY
jgi:hypothetical protein